MVDTFVEMFEMEIVEKKGLVADGCSLVISTDASPCALPSLCIIDRQVSMLSPQSSCHCPHCGACQNNTTMVAFDSL